MAKLASASPCGPGLAPFTAAHRPGVPALYRGLEHAFDRSFGGALNPLKHLGALAFLLFWLLAISGVVLYIVLDTSAQGAYRSIDELSRGSWRFGSALRGLHRYAADAFVFVTLAHLVREWLLGRYSGFRRFSWLTGVPLLPLAYVCGIGGFWLNWDRLGQFSAVATAEWLDALPFLASPLARNFLGGAVNDRLFSLFVFVHLGVPLLLVFGLWFHIQRISRAEVFPPRALAVGTTAALLALALALPIRSQGPADLTVVPGPVSLDWFLLFIHPLTEATSDGFVWALLAAAILGLFALPFVRARPASPVAQVDPANCNGCRRCADDCPYGAITMVSHPNGRPGMQLAQVRSELCASCGICVGACPSSTPFRKTQTLVTGIDMPQWPIDDLRRRLVQGLAAMRTGQRLVVFGCDQGAQVQALAAPDVLQFSLVCAGMLPPSFVEYALRAGADGVLISGCREGGCEFRLGQRWTAQRLLGEREPHLRSSVPEQRWNAVWADAGDEGAVRTALDRLRRQSGAAAAPAAMETAA
jgi:quinol-cytochrome oxidoreductase complex cytochrome b subunit/coenzyme F420-reducing hydrogenase delta subunit/NAD-dependent dihydropyrimidine dehydrogenase PreA subunit